MKTSIKQYYKEPQVQSARIMSYVLGHFWAQRSYEPYIVALIAMGGLLLVFIVFLAGLNLSFFSVALKVYMSVGSSFFILCNLLVWVTLFIIEYHVLIIAFLLMIIGIEMGISAIKRTPQAMPAKRV